MKYTAENVLRIAKRINNAKRGYLLVNPLQGKHIPVSPKKSLGMMRTFGKFLAGKYPDTRLVIGFAETATAIGAAACECFSDKCVYIHTTRENFAGEFVYFSEEHSHAVEQKLYAEALGELILAARAIVLIDDEFSTGKTLINIVECFRKRFPEAEGKEFIAASLINRVSEENEQRLLSAGIKSEYLVKLDNYSFDVEKFEVVEAERVPTKIDARYETLRFPEKIPNARLGVEIGCYKRKVRELAKRAVKLLDLPKNSDLLILGTEECMYPALIFGEVFEEINGGGVLCHSTTRSPIGICKAEGYSITSGFKLRSLYDSSRDTYIYDLAKHDNVVIISDSKDDTSAGIEDLVRALKIVGCGRIFYLRGAEDVRHL